MRKIIFTIEERVNIFKNSRKEYVLKVKFVDHMYWTLKTWDKKPDKKVIDETKELILRSFEFYHRHLYIPIFNIEIIEE